MSSTWIVIALTLTSLLAILAAIPPIYVFVRYSPVVARIFEEKPLFLPLRAPRAEDGEDVRFPARDGLTLVGTYLKARTPRRAGVLVFCHEFLGDRWSALPYLGHLRDRGFDLFTFDFRNHGESDHDPGYKPLQWVTQHETNDLIAALAYLRNRPDADPAGVGLFGVSRGAGTALCVASKDISTWGVITDGAFPARGTMLSYINRWAEIYVRSPKVWKMLPPVAFEYLGWTGRIRSQFRLGCRYSNVERAVGRLSPRPWLAIHGQKDALIGLAIAQELFSRAGEPKEMWVVEKAKHNGSRLKDPVAYAERLTRFVDQYAPRRLSNPEPAVPVESSPTLDGALTRNPVAGALTPDESSRHLVGAAPFASLPIRGELGITLPS